MVTRATKTYGSQLYVSEGWQFSGNIQTYYAKSGPQLWSTALAGSITGVSNPGYKNQIQKRSNASTAYSRKEWTFIHSAHCNYTWESGDLTHRKSWARTIGELRNFGSLSSAAISNNTNTGLADVALLRLKRRLSAASGSVNAMAPLAEINDLHRTIRGTVELTTTFAKTILDLKRTRGRSGLKYASKAWLTWNFGMNPLIRDTQSILKSINDYIHRSDLSTRLYASASTTGQYVFDMGVAYDNISFPCNVSYELSYRYVGAFDLFLKSANNYSLFDQLNLTPAAIVPTAWELMPFSWAIDYFTNVGNFLEDTFQVPPGNLRYLCLDRRYRAHFQIGIKPIIPTGGRLIRFSGKDGEAEYFEFERTLASVLPHIGLRIKTIDEVGQFGLSKLANLLSILGKEL